MASIGVNVIRSAFSMAERVAPGLAAVAAFGMFCRTPNPKSMSVGEARAVERAAALMAEARHHRIRTLHGCLAVYEFRPLGSRFNAGTVLVVHGWRSRTEFMRALILAYRDAGFRVLSLDLPGHGGSSGRRLTLVDAVRAIHAVGQWFGPFSAIVGHSFGGAVAANAVAGSIAGVGATEASRLVLIAAPSSLRIVFERFFDFLAIGPRTRARVVARVGRLAGRPLDELDGTSQLAQARVPTLVVHAPDDREVPSSHAVAFAKAGPHVHVHWADGLGHRRILSEPAVVRQALDFVSRSLATAD